MSDIPIIGPLVFGHDVLVYLSVISVALVAWFLNSTRAGLLVRAVGENHDAAHSIGYSVMLVRMGAILFGGAMAGIGGAYLSVAYTPLWVENMTAGRGWIALALVVFASWKPWRAFLVPTCSAASPSSSFMRREWALRFPRSSYRCYHTSRRSWYWL